MSVHAEGVDALRMHYVDAGPRRRPGRAPPPRPAHMVVPVPHVIAVLTRRGLRAVAPDNIGFGRSDKPTDRTLYTYRRHVGLDDEPGRSGSTCADVTLVVQDWGGPIGLGALAAVPERFARVVATNTALHTSDPTLAGKLTWANHGTGDGRVVLEESLVDYVQYCQRAPELVASTFLYAASQTLSPEVLAAYDAPFPDKSFTAGLRQMTRAHPPHRQRPRSAHRARHDRRAAGLATPVPHGLLRRRPRHPGMGDRAPGDRARGGGAGAPDHQRRGALRPRRARRRARADRRGFRRGTRPRRERQDPERRRRDRHDPGTR